MNFNVSAIVPALASALVSIVWQSILLVLCVELCARLVPSLSARLRSFFWVLAMVAMLVLPLASLLHTSAAGSAAHLRLGTFLATALVLGWAALSMLSATHLLYSAVHLYRVVGEAERVPAGPEIAALLSEAKVELCTSSAVDVPSVAGFFRRRILLPLALYAELTPADLRHIVLHELEHLRRHDDWINLVQKLAVIVFPLNPALLWAERRLCLERELACDDAVLRADHTGAKAYATCLVNLAEHGLLRRGMSLALGAWRRPSELPQRVHRILNRRQIPVPRSAYPAMAACLVAIFAGTAIVSARAPQLVSFGSAPAASMAKVPKDSLHGNPLISSPFHPMLVKASMRQRSRSSVTFAGVARSHAQVHLRCSIRARRSRNRRTSGVVLIDWQPGRSSAPRAIYTHATWMLTSSPTFTYAAVPTGAGWLVIQL